MIGIEHKAAAVYLLDNQQPSLPLQISSSESINYENILNQLWHVRLGHLSFRSLDVLFLNLFNFISPVSIV